ncbi:acyl-CoA thioesterase [Thiohalorhabdus sp.]|uniref:acyl-CoA thioesterase n=1 Tax=Thiohalorhabdus sp. TaxID=3094134 RepID=UPI002FC34AD3
MSEERDGFPEGPPTTRMVATTTDTNAAGDIFGGWIMAQVDIAEAVVAYRRARGRVVTAAVNAFQFHQPVYVGDLVSFYAQVERVGTTSLTVSVAVFAERDNGGSDSEHICQRVTEATLTYVAVDEQRHKRPMTTA